MCMFRVFGGGVETLLSGPSNSSFVFKWDKQRFCSPFVIRFSVFSLFCVGWESEAMESLIPHGSRLNSEQNTNAAPLWPRETFVLLRRILRCVSFAPCLRKCKAAAGRVLSYSLWLSANATAGIILLNGRGSRCVSFCIRDVFPWGIFSGGV